MPRPNQPRPLADNVARRIAYERESRGWTYENIAKRMADAGCPINASAMYKIEKGKPRRQVLAVEMFALARIFELPVTELAVPPELAAEREIVATLQAWASAADAIGRATREHDEVIERLRGLLAATPSSIAAAAAYLGDYVGERWPSYTLDQTEEAVDYLLLTLRGLPKDSPEWRAFHDQYGNPRGTNGEH